MRVKKSWLRNVIIEETSKYLNELNTLHNEKGHFAGWETDAKSYSLATSKRNKYAPNSKDGKFKVTGKGKLSARYGLPSCGRTDVTDASPIPKKYHCAKYPKRYGVTEEGDIDILTGEPMGDSETTRWKSDRGRKKKLFGGYDDLRRLASLIPERELSELIVDIGLEDEQSGLLIKPDVEDTELDETPGVRCSPECNAQAWRKFILTLGQIKRAEKGDL